MISNVSRNMQCLIASGLTIYFATRRFDPSADNIQDIPPHKAPHHPGGPAHRVDSGEPVADNIRQHVRAGPHPGMRAAAQENARQAKGSPGRGMMGVILPLYAVGIVVYLVYTLCKVFNKKDPDERRDSESPSHEERTPERTFEKHYGDDEGRVSSMQGATLTPAQVQKELQSLLSKAQDKHMTESEMQQLQSRLGETEAQMTKILQAMQSVQSRVVEQAGSQEAGNEEVGSQDTGNQDSEAPPGGEKLREPEPSEFTADMERNKSMNASDRSSESNGDTESFEILNKSTSGSDVSAKVDTVTSRTVEEQNTDADEEDDGDEEVEEEEEESEEASEEEDSMEEMEDGESDGEAKDVMMDQEPTPTQDDVTVRKRMTTKDDSQS